MTTSLTSNKVASKAQVRRVRTLTKEAVDDVFDNVVFTHDQLQTLHAKGGFYKKELSENLKAFVTEFRLKALGLAVPSCAKDTGLVPEYWRVGRDDLEGEVNLAKLDFSVCPLRPGEACISTQKMLKRAKERLVYGSLGFGKLLLDHQDMIPTHLRRKIHILLPRTIVVNPVGHRCVGLLFWDDHVEGWAQDFLSLSLSTNYRDRFVVPAE